MLLHLLIFKYAIKINYMQQKNGVNSIFLLSIIALMGWFAVLMQLYLILLNRKLSVPATVLQYFSFFTILTNIIVAVCATCIILKPNTATGIFFRRPTVLTAITLYIVVVGLVYNFVLRFLWAPVGLQKLVDELLHTLIPFLFLVYWFIAVPKQSLQWKNVFSWLLYPLFYSFYILIRGYLTGLYPYPFMDVTQLGYPTVFKNCGYLVIVFLLGALLFIAAGKLPDRFGAKGKPF